MATTATLHPSGTYSYLPAIDAYSSGIAAAPGYAIVGLRFAHHVPFAEAMRRIDDEIARRGLEPTSLAALQLRSPAVMSPSSFGSFNNQYLTELGERGLLIDGASPLARTNVVPVFGAPAEPVVFAAFLVVPREGADGDFVVAGSGESVDGVDAEHITAFADITAGGLRSKVQLVVSIMLERLVGLGATSASPTDVGVYTAHDIEGLATLLAAHLPACEWGGFTTYPSRPPVAHIEYEMDCTRVSEWTLIDSSQR